jgi:hypothetical protein
MMTSSVVAHKTSSDECQVNYCTMEASKYALETNYQERDDLITSN